MRISYEFETSDDLQLILTIMTNKIVEDLVSITYTCVCGASTKTIKNEGNIEEQAIKDKEFIERHSKCYEKTISTFN